MEIAWQDRVRFENFYVFWVNRLFNISSDIDPCELAAVILIVTILPPRFMGGFFIDRIIWNHVWITRTRRWRPTPLAPCQTSHVSVCSCFRDGYANGFCNTNGTRAVLQPVPFTVSRMEPRLSRLSRRTFRRSETDKRDEPLWAKLSWVSARIAALYMVVILRARHALHYPRRRIQSPIQWRS